MEQFHAWIVMYLAPELGSGKSMQPQPELWGKHSLYAGFAKLERCDGCWWPLCSHQAHLLSKGWRETQSPGVAVWALVSSHISSQISLSTFWLCKLVIFLFHLSCLELVSISYSWQSWQIQNWVFTDLWNCFLYSKWANNIYLAGLSWEYKMQYIH